MVLYPRLGGSTLPTWYPLQRFREQDPYVVNRLFSIYLKRRKRAIGILTGGMVELLLRD